MKVNKLKEMYESVDRMNQATIDGKFDIVELERSYQMSLREEFKNESR